MNLPSAAAKALLGSGVALAAGALAVQNRAARAAAAARRLAEEDAVAARMAARRAEQAARTATRELDELRRRAEGDRRAYQNALEETRHLVEQRLPAVVDVEVRRHPAVVVPGLLEPDLKGTPFDRLHQAAEELVREAVRDTRAGVVRAGRAGVRGVTDEAQTFLTRLQMKIDEELDRHPTAGAYHQGLIEIDHLATRSLHMLQRLRILAGSWPGMQRADCTFREIVESARGRIGPYSRIHYTYRPEPGEVFVEGRVVEPVTVALAELLANAADYSSEPVGVYVQRVQAGYRVVVEDTGLGMNRFQLAEAERLLTHRTLLDVTNLTDERKLGFAVIGRLAHDYGFRVDVGAPSASGGVKAVLLVPNGLLGTAPAEHAPSTGDLRGEEPAPAPLTSPAPTTSPAATAPGSSTAPGNLLPALTSPGFGTPATSTSPTPSTASTASTAETPPTTPEPVTTASGLPKRQPRQAAAERPPAASQEAMTDTADPEQLIAGFEQMRRALSEGYGVNDTDSGGHHTDDQ